MAHVCMRKLLCSSGTKTIFAGSSCNDLVTLHSTLIISGHFDKRVRFWDSRSDNTSNEIGLHGRITSLALSPGNLFHFKANTLSNPTQTPTTILLSHTLLLVCFYVIYMLVWVVKKNVTWRFIVKTKCVVSIGWRIPSFASCEQV